MSLLHICLGIGAEPSKCERCVPSLLVLALLLSTYTLSQTYMFDIHLLGRVDEALVLLS